MQKWSHWNHCCVRISCVPSQREEGKKKFIFLLLHAVCYEGTFDCHKKTYTEKELIGFCPH